MMFDARRKIHAHLVANGYLDAGGDVMNRWQALGQFLRTDPRDVRCEQAMELLGIYADTVSADGADAAERSYPGVAAHLRACGPCGEDFAGLLAAVTRTAS